MKLKLIYPLNPGIIITQLFGNVTPTYTNMGLKGHNGIDFLTTHGQPIYASHDGYASYQVDSGGGHGVVVITDKQFDNDKGGTTFYKTIYWHMVDPLREPKFKSPLADKTGFVKVETGDLIGYADNTGLSTGDHLHFAIKPVAEGETWGSFYNLNQNNGYGGCIDPMPFFDKNYPVTIDLMKKQISALKMLIDILKKKIVLQ